MTQGMRTWRALGVGLGLVLGGLSGCTTPEKKPASTQPPRGQVGPPTAGGGTAGMTRPGVQATQPTGFGATSPAYNRAATTPNATGTVTPAGGTYPSVQPATSTSSSFSGQSPFDAMPQKNFTPGMGVSPRNTNPAQMPLQTSSMSPTSMPAMTQMPSTNYPSDGQAATDSRLTAASTASGMTGARPIPTNIASLPPSPAALEIGSGGPTPPMPPSGVGVMPAAPMGSLPPVSGEGPVPPTPPSSFDPRFGGH